MSATATIVVDLGFGDAGKGSIVDAVVRHRGAGGVVRFNGGCQAGHNIVDEHRVFANGKTVEHTCAQFGAGVLAGARTHLSRYMMVEPISLFNEAEHLVECGIRHPIDTLTVDPRALVTTPLHKLANQEKERRRASGHGSCGRGIGETVEFMLNRPLDAIRVADLWRPTLVAEKMRVLADYYEALVPPNWSPWADMWSQACTRFTDTVELAHDRDILMSWRAGMDHVVFEGAQGVLIDEQWGFAPYHTWSNCTFDNALLLLQEAEYLRSDVTKLGVTRAYQVRHGPGPMPTENETMTRLLPDEWNVTNDWQGGFRVGNLDMVLLKYAIRACEGIDELAVTCLDRVRDVVWMTSHAEARIIQVKGQYPDWEMDEIKISHWPGPAICVAYQHPRWGLFEQPLYEWRLPMSDKHTTPAQVLADMKPVLEPWPLNFPAWMTEQLGVPVTVLSYGPGAGAKSWLDAEVVRG